MMRIATMMAIALMAAACQPMPATSAPGPQPTQVSAAGTTDAALCASQGGKMLPQGRMGTERCVLSYADGGKRCTDGDDCQGDCRIDDVAAVPASGQAAVGRCQAASGRFGCYATVENGRAEPTICVD